VSTNPPTPLTPREREALDRLEQWVDGRDDPNPRAAVVTRLTTEEIDSAAAQRLLDQLLSKGYLYESDDGIRVTDPGSRD
jgi:predicted 2-oxoglutarate/Fe(II)-dependent dioxygenase YbiX